MTLSYPYSVEELVLDSVGNVEAEFACWFAFVIMNRRWFEVEHIIMKNPHAAYRYAKELLRTRWVEAEPYILKDASCACLYAQHVIKGRWPEAESIILKNDIIANMYAIIVMGERWLEAESIILKNVNCAEYYIRFFNEVGTYSKDVPVVIRAYAITDISNTVTNLQLLNILNVLRPPHTKELNERDIRDSRVFYEPTLKQRLIDGDFDKISIYDILNDKVPDFWNRLIGYQCNDFE